MQTPWIVCQMYCQPDLLEVIDIAHKLFTELPGPLPPISRQLSVQHNALNALPVLPASLTLLYVGYNSLDDLPDDVAARLPAQCTVNLQGNPLSAAAVGRFHTALLLPDYRGPKLVF